MSPLPKSTAASGSLPAPPPISATFTNLDVGSPKLVGSARPVERGWDITAGGADIWHKTDEFHFVFQEVSGDFDIAVRVERFTPAHLYSKAGLMIRESVNADSAHLMFLVFSCDAARNNNLGAYEMQFRLAAGADCQGIYPAVRPPAPSEFPAAYPNSWLRVARHGHQFSAFASTDGTAWKLFGGQVLPLSSKVKVGPALTSHHPEVASHAAFRDYTEHQQTLPK